MGCGYLGGSWCLGIRAFSRYVFGCQCAFARIDAYLKTRLKMEQLNPQQKAETRTQGLPSTRSVHSDMSTKLATIQ